MVVTAAETREYGLQGVGYKLRPASAGFPRIGLNWDTALCALPSNGLTQLRSISTATDLWRSVTETTMRSCLRASIKRPSTPHSGPSSTRTRWPTAKYGQGSTERPDRMVACIAATSASSIDAG